MKDIFTFIWRREVQFELQSLILITTILFLFLSREYFNTFSQFSVEILPFLVTWLQSLWIYCGFKCIHWSQNVSEHHIWGHGVLWLRYIETYISDNEITPSNFWEWLKLKRLKTLKVEEDVEQAKLIYCYI